ncbi:DUF192 domain-containing protein [Paraburkholderia sp. PREW-6R]|uniref:DUF192 domain-containing protein n=1 Tax=Paraburkholderia sp. PREW-6R TaxID=3141544 RepID=UPI0031F4AA35
MKVARLYAEGRDTTVQVSVTQTAGERMRGLLGRDDLASGEALLLTRCGSVHTFGMRFSIDVVFLDRRQQIVAIHYAVPKHRIVFSLRATETLEMPAYSARTHGLAVGDQLVFEVLS